METRLTRVSSKGQIVIPKEIREKLKIKDGDMFATAREKDLIVLKKIKDPILEKDLKILEKVEEAWQDMEKGNFKRLKKEQFLKELESW